MAEDRRRRFRAALDRLEPRPYAGTVYRHHAEAYGPLSGEGARLHGGRWNPPGSTATVYAASDVATVDAELRRSLDAARLRPEDLRRRTLATIRFSLGRVLDLRDPAVRDALGVTLDQIRGADVALTRAIGQAAIAAGYEAIVAPSAVGRGHVLALFLANRHADSQVEVVSSRPYAART